MHLCEIASVLEGIDRILVEAQNRKRITRSAEGGTVFQSYQIQNRDDPEMLRSKLLKKFRSWIHIFVLVTQ